MTIKKSNKAVTFVELLIAISIAVFIGMVLFSTLSQGIKIWGRVHDENPEYNLELGFEKIAVMVRNVLNSSLTQFAGQPKSFEFVTLKSNPKIGEQLMMPVKMKFSFDEHLKALKISEIDYKALLNNETKKESMDSLVLEGMLNCKFQYYYYDKEYKSYAWQDSWNYQCVPEAVKISVDYISHAQTRNLYKIISIPTGGCKEV